MHVLEAEDLEHGWPELDAFEGSEYRRVLTRVYSAEPDARYLFDAYLYAVA